MNRLHRLLDFITGATDPAPEHRDPAPLGTPRPQCGTPDPKYAEGIRALAADPEVADDSFPKTERRVRSWLIRDGYGRAIGTAFEDPATRVITVSWAENIPESARKRTSWVDIEALEYELSPRRSTSWTGVHAMMGPIRLRPLFPKDRNILMDGDDW